MSVPVSDEQLFKMAGLENNSILGRWDFFLGSAFGITSPAKTADSSEAARMRMIDDIDLDNLSLSGTSSPSATAGANSTDNAAAISEIKTKKKKPKKKKNASKSSDRSLKWGDVEQICFTRSIGYDRIPNKGSYPIGLGHEVERIKSSVDELYNAQQMHLLQRAVARGIDLATLTKAAHVVPPPPPASPNGANGEHDSPQVGLKGKKISHRKRSNSVSSVESVPHSSTATATAILSSASSGGKGAVTNAKGPDTTMPALETRQYDYKGAANPLFQALGEDERIALLTSENVDIAHDPHSNANPLTEVNNEIKQLKSHRSDGLGCNCKHTKIDKLSIAKLRAELLSRGHLICYEGTPTEVEKLSKTELTQKVKDVLKVCVLCVANDCQCFQAGIPCSAQLCGCSRNGHHPGQAQSCANPNGMDLYDPERVKEYRRTVLRSVSIDLTPASIKA